MSDLVRIELSRWRARELAGLIRDEAIRIEADAASKRRGSPGRARAEELAKEWRAIAARLDEHA